MLTDFQNYFTVNNRDNRDDACLCDRNVAVDARAGLPVGRAHVSLSRVGAARRRRRRRLDAVCLLYTSDAADE